MRQLGIQGVRRGKVVRTTISDNATTCPQDKVHRQFRAEGPNAASRLIKVVDVKQDTIQIDANHPLAGQTLNFDVKVVSIRDASQEELDHGHVHGAGGHHH